MSLVLKSEVGKTPLWYSGTQGKCDIQFISPCSLWYPFIDQHKREVEQLGANCPVQNQTWVHRFRARYANHSTTWRSCANKRWNISGVSYFLYWEELMTISYILILKLIKMAGTCVTKFFTSRREYYIWSLVFVLTLSWQPENSEYTFDACWSKVRENGLLQVFTVLLFKYCFLSCFLCTVL